MSKINMRKIVSGKTGATDSFVVPSESSETGYMKLTVAARPENVALSEWLRRGDVGREGKASEPSIAPDGAESKLQAKKSAAAAVASAVADYYAEYEEQLYKDYTPDVDADVVDSANRIAAQFAASANGKAHA